MNIDLTTVYNCLAFSNSGDAADSFVDAESACWDTANCTGAGGPYCEENICKLRCDPDHEVPTEDGNCTTRISFRDNSPKTGRVMLKWYKAEDAANGSLVAEFTFDEFCDVDADCVVIIGLDEPPAKNYDFYPRTQQFWPSNHVSA